jgi:hypothetical protein
MLKFDLNWLHIGALSLANFFIGFAWYSLLFNKIWIKALKITPKDMHSDKAKAMMPRLMGTAALSAVLMSLGCQVLVSNLGAADAASGALAGFFFAVVLVAAHESGSLFERRPTVVFGISALHAIAILSLDSAALAAWH